mmetsp:Transcript_39381/g.82820  ORF Transcript_39381/g.82820 Transcript_39381/m.82820 type:complete len:346 (-) Transcript_39381:117-1154(-)
MRLSIKYLLFDVVTILSIAAGFRRLLGNGDGGRSTATECNGSGGVYANQTCTPKEQLQEQHQDQQYVIFDLDEMVEFYEPQISYAFVAVIDRVFHDENGSILYDIRTEINDEIFLNVKPDKLERHKEYEFDTPAMCEFGEALFKKSHLFPCSVRRKAEFYGDDIYTVITMKDGELKYRKMHVSRIRRIVNMPESMEGKPFLPISNTLFPVTEETSHLEIGGLVEIHSEDGKYGIPGTIMYYIKESNDYAKYDVENGITKEMRNQLDPEMVHRYEVYEIGASALCNLGTPQELDMTPCIIVSHSIEKSDNPSYQISYLNEDVNIWVDKFLSWDRVQRVLDEGESVN